MECYFDNAATTRVCPEAAEAALRMMTEEYGNPSATYSLGRSAKSAVDHARAPDVVAVILHGAGNGLGNRREGKPCCSDRLKEGTARKGKGAHKFSC